MSLQKANLSVKTELKTFHQGHKRKCNQSSIPSADVVCYLFFLHSELLIMSDLEFSCLPT